MKTKKSSNNSNLKYTLKKKSFSPSINRKLDVNILKTIEPNKVNFCNDVLKINVGTRKNKRCLNYDNNETIKYLLRNLQSSKHLIPQQFIAPKQLYANCWFNTMFVVFFFSDKGRKFFRFLRVLMITGKTYDGRRIKNTELKKLLFVLNLYIEASYNQLINKKIYNEVSYLSNDLNTNYFISKIYNIINKTKYNVPNINIAGNPLEYYKTIMKYLNYDILKLMNIDIDKKYENIKEILEYKFNNIDKNIDIIVIEDHESKTKYETSYELIKDNKTYKYVLDSIIITNKEHYNPKENSHFVAVLTINGKGYKFDGSSYSRLSRFDWKKYINSNKIWKFIENPNYKEEEYSFIRGYKILFYYRDNI